MVALNAFEVQTEDSMKMKSLFLAVFLALFVVVPVGAQVHVGIVGGLNLANMSMDPDGGADLSGRTVFGFGGVFDAKVDGNISMHLVPMYIQKGGVRTKDGFENEIKLTYLDIHFLLKFSVGTDGAKPYVMAGPTLGINLSATELKTGDGAPVEEDMKDDVKGTDFGFLFGAGVNLPMGNKSLFVEARYALGVTDINDTSGDAIVKTFGFQLFTGFTFGLGGS